MASCRLFVEAADYTIWRGNFDNTYVTATDATQVVPKPATWEVALLGLLVI